MSNTSETNFDWWLEKAPHLVSAWIKIRSYFAKKQPDKPNTPLAKILIVGCGGVGKSTLHAILTGAGNDLLADLHSYEESIGEECDVSASDEHLELTVLPGQKLRREVAWPMHLKAVEDGGYKGLILVDCFGYHSIGEVEVTSHKLWKGDIVSFRKDFLAAQRDDEHEVINRLIAHLKRRSKPIWVLHIVTKPDLWWAKRSQCASYLAAEPYIGLQNSLPQGSRIECVQTCLAISNATTIDGKRLFDHNVDYDQQKRLKTLEALTKMVIEMQKWCANA